MSLTDRKSFLKASRRLKLKSAESPGGSGSDRCDVPSKRSKKSGKKRSRKAKLSPAEKPSGKRKRKTDRSADEEDDDDGSHPAAPGETTSPAETTSALVGDTSPAQTTSAAASENVSNETADAIGSPPAAPGETPPVACTMSPHAASGEVPVPSAKELESSSSAEAAQPAPAIVSCAAMSPPKKIVRRVRYQDSPPDFEPDMILDAATGEFRPRRPDDGEITAESDSEVDEDAAEDDDFYDRQYVGEASSDDDDDAAPVLAEDDTPPVWRMSETTDANIFEETDFDHERGPTFTLPSHSREIDYFFKFIPATLIRLAKDETNKYAKFHQRYIARKIDKYWRNADYREVQAFIGVLVCMGIDRKSSVEDYWSSDPFLRNQGISTVITRSRFQQLMRYFHLADPENDPRRDPDEARRRRRCQEDPLYKINPWMEPIVDRCVNNYKMGREISIDEGMVRFKGRSKFKQRLPHKPDRDGFKIWQLCDSTTAYIANFAPYLGVKFRDRTDGRRQERGVVKRITMELVQPFCGYNHSLFCDSLFSTVVTARELMETGTYMVGSFNRRNRRTMPPQLIPPGKRKRLPLSVGDMKATTRTDSRLNITAYQDSNAQVLILNTVYPPLECVPVGEGDEQRQVPLSLYNYRRYMGGVDRANQKRKYFHTGRKNHRWWTYLACYLIDVALVNAYICFKHVHPDSKLTHKMFHLRVGKQLIGGYCGRSQPSVREVEATVSLASYINPQNQPMHVVSRLEGRQKCCKVCSREGKTTASGRLSETSKGCSLCGVHLHEGECFAAFHHRMMLRGKRSIGVQTSTHTAPTTPISKRTRRK